MVKKKYKVIKSFLNFKFSDHNRINDDCQAEEEEVEMDGNAVLEDVEPAVLEDVEPGPGGSNENRAPRVETFRWGAFRFTPKGSPNTEGFGWEASCPFHRKNDSTGCKKSLSVAVAGSSDRAIHALKYWCTAALDVDRQWKHLNAVDIHGELPGEALIEAKIIHADAKPSVHVVPDSQLDAGQNRRGRGRGRAIAAESNRRERGRGRGRGGGRPGRPGRAIATAAEAAESAEGEAAEAAGQIAPDAEAGEASSSSDGSDSSDSSSSSSSS